jgi:tRNA(Ile2) C34 agmatinyltransferase TiaS
MADEQKGTPYVVLRAIGSSVELGDAIETLGGLVSAAGGEGDEALDVVKDALARPAFVEAAEQSAPNDIAAIRAAEKATGQKFDRGAVAIPKRSWRPRMPKDEMVPRRLWT